MASAKNSGKSVEASKKRFGRLLTDFVTELGSQIVTESGEWAIKGFIDADRRIYTVSSDTKLISKILEIHLLPYLFYFAKIHDYEIVLADHQNYYPDITFIENTGAKFLLILKPHTGSLTIQNIAMVSPLAHMESISPIGSAQKTFSSHIASTPAIFAWALSTTAKKNKM